MIFGTIVRNKDMELKIVRVRIVWEVTRGGLRLFQLLYCICLYFLKKNLNAPRPSEHPPVRGEKCQNV